MKFVNALASSRNTATLRDDSKQTLQVRHSYNAKTMKTGTLCYRTVTSSDHAEFCLPQCGQQAPGGIIPLQ